MGHLKVFLAAWIILAIPLGPAAFGDDLPPAGGEAAKPAAPVEAKTSAEATFEKHHEGSDKMKKRLEELFTWRVSDRLQLSSEEEAKFTDQFKKLSDERAKLYQDMDAVLDKIDREKDNTANATKLLGDYNSILKKMSQVQVKEMDVMTKLFGTKRMIQYVLLKREMTQRFKKVLSSNSPGSVARASKGKGPPPNTSQEPDKAPENSDQK